jgi:hypothetical protein
MRPKCVTINRQYARPSTRLTNSLPQACFIAKPLSTKKKCTHIPPLALSKRARSPLAKIGCQLLRVEQHDHQRGDVTNCGQFVEAATRQQGLSHSVFP